MKFTVTIESNNAAFSDDATLEVSNILDVVRDQLDKGHTAGPVFDSNGNKVGQFRLDE
jgi:hypothetical protein